MIRKTHRSFARLAAHPRGLFVGLIMSVLILNQCTPAFNSPAPAASQSAGSYADPFAYCAIVGSVDTPESAYVGPPMPLSIIDGLKQAAGLSADMPHEILELGTVWRCMNGRVWACFVGANLPCSEKADTSQTPAQPLVDFCRANPAADVIPAAVTGRATVYEWRCTNGTPAIVNQIFQPDDQGFIADFWYKIDTPASGGF